MAVAIDSLDEYQGRAVYNLYTRLVNTGWKLHTQITKHSIPVLTGITSWNVPPVCHVRGCAEVYAAKLRREKPYLLWKLVEV